MRFPRVFCLVTMITFLSGCTVLVKEDPAYTEAQRNQCIVGTALVGTIVGSIASPLGAGVGTLAGGALGTHFCGDAAPVPAPEEPEQSGYFWPDDQDRDGVVDADDACPFTPDGIAVDGRGCALDDDHDGVPNYLDQCPNTPFGNVVDTDGCSLALVKLQGIHFAFDSASLTGEARSILDSSISAIKSNPSQNLQVEGHTDSTGSDDYNLGLSQRRAEAVVNYLVSKGISSSRLNAKGYGESSPISSNDSSNGRAQNRRVEIYAR